jgi:hypothetical protein
LRSKKPVLVLADIIKERRALEEAIGKVEADAARKLRTETQELRLTAPDGGRQIPSATRDRANSPSTDLPEDGWPAVLSSARDRLLSVRSSRRKQAASDLREVIGDRDDLHSIDHDTRQQRGREPASNSKEELVALPVQDTLMAPEVEEEQKHPSGRERSYRGAASSPGPDWSRSLPKLLIVSGVITAATLNDVRVMIERHLPAASRAKEMWMYVSNELRKAALGGDMAEFCLS